MTQKLSPKGVEYFRQVAERRRGNDNVTSLYLLVDKKDLEKFPFLGSYNYVDLVEKTIKEFSPEDATLFYKLGRSYD